MPRLARSLLTLIGWCRIYYVFQIRRALHSAFYSCKLSLLGKKSYYHQNFLNIASNMQVESSATPLLTIDEVEKVQRQKIARSDMCSTLLIRLWLTNNKLSWTLPRLLEKTAKNAILGALFPVRACETLRVIPCNNCSTMKYMRHLYPVSILLYAAFVNKLYELTSPHLHTNWLYSESPLTYCYKNTKK